MPRLMEIADVQTGPFGSQLHKEDYVEIGTPIITVEHLGEKIFSEQNLPKVSDADKERLAKYVLEEGDTVFSRVGSVDRCSYVDSAHAGWMFSGRCLRVRPNNSVNPEYLYYFFSTEETKKLIRSIAVGATMPSINTKILSDIEVTLPSIEEQRKVVEVLAAFDKKIQINREINRNLQEQAACIFSEWLATCDEEISIGDMADNIIDYNIGNYEQVVLINSSDVTNGNFEHHDISDNKDLKGHFKKAFKKWDILYSEIRPRNKHYAYCQFEPNGYIASTRLMIIRNKPNVISSSMLYQYLMLRNVFEEFTLKTESRSGTFPQGRYEDMAAIKVPYSTMGQDKVTQILDDLYAMMWNNEKENLQLKDLRDSLLPKLMSGELDVSDLDI